MQQAIDSLIEAARYISYEIIVVDNASKDHTVEMLNLKYPQIKVIPNQGNLGFSKANNQAINQATGEYLLIINPDTITGKKTLIKVLTFMDKHPDAGALGVRMINGQGKFLKESKRGFPTPWVAFSHLTGLSKLFPRSKLFYKYHAGHIDEFELSEVDVLAGAFMFIRNEALKKVGLFDESFFMYGEDIDLSYRMKLAGYKNFYYPETYIIHFKGQSTKKLNWKYIRSFYGAMFIFANKYFFKF